jgi:transposase
MHTPFDNYWKLKCSVKSRKNAFLRAMNVPLRALSAQMCAALPQHRSQLTVQRRSEEAKMPNAKNRGSAVQLCI